MLGFFGSGLGAEAEDEGGAERAMRSVEAAGTGVFEGRASRLRGTGCAGSGVAETDGLESGCETGGREDGDVADAEVWGAGCASGWLATAGALLPGAGALVAGRVFSGLLFESPTSIGWRKYQAPPPTVSRATAAMASQSPRLEPVCGGC